ncbi:MAG: hypothetical protein HY918_02510 [Candidatus Doudnabacteria bacterium]|nr:hypothetical protein [Candidatus Doudnabacteria bacterium]
MTGRDRFTLCIGQQLRLQLEKQAKLDGRHLQQQVLYLLEVMLAVAREIPSFRLKPERQERTEPGLAIKLCLTDWLNEQTFHLAGYYGLTQQQFMRTMLWMGLDWCERVCPKDQVLSKEDFLIAVLAMLKPVPVQ